MAGSGIAAGRSIFRRIKDAGRPARTPGQGRRSRIRAPSSAVPAARAAPSPRFRARTPPEPTNASRKDPRAKAGKFLGSIVLRTVDNAEALALLTLRLLQVQYIIRIKPAQRTLNYLQSRRRGANRRIRSVDARRLDLTSQYLVAAGDFEGIPVRIVERDV